MTLALAQPIDDTGGGRYRALAFRRLVLILCLVAALFLSVAVDMALGPANYRLSDVLTALFHPASVDDQLRVVIWDCLLYTSPSPRDGLLSRMPSSA